MKNKNSLLQSKNNQTTRDCDDAPNKSSGENQDEKRFQHQMQTELQDGAQMQGASSEPTAYCSNEPSEDTTASNDDQSKRILTPEKPSTAAQADNRMKSGNDDMDTPANALDWVRSLFFCCGWNRA